MELFEETLFDGIQILAEKEEDKGYKLLTISGTASRAGIVNKNRRLYPTAVLAKAVEKAQDSIKKGKFLGEVDHPEWQGSLGRTAVKFTRLYMEGDLVFFEGEVLATQAGEHLALLLRSGVGVGVSTRGYGSTRPIDGPDGTFYEVQPDFELKGIDCVLDESNEFGKVANFESKGGGKRMELTLEILQTEHPDLYAQVVEKVTADVKAEVTESIEKEFELKVAQAVEDKKEEFVEGVKQEVMESEEITQLKSIVESVVDAVKPLIPEAKTKEELDADLVKTVADLEEETETLKGVIETLKEEKANAEKVLTEQENAKKVIAKVDELVEGHRFEKALRQKLDKCATEEEVQEMFESELAFITALVENTEIPSGSGKSSDEEDGKGKLSEEAIRQQRLAGINEGGK